jgi:hypothetical protein
MQLLRPVLPLALLLILLAAGFALPAGAVAAEERPLPSRQAFATQMNKVERGMTQKQVLALLGRPDRTVPTPISPRFVIWLYGCYGPEAVPTLGQVLFDDKGTVYGKTDGQGSPPAPSVISETELRRALCLLDQTPGLSGFDPLALIRVVNRLLPLGKDKALAAIDEYQRVFGLRDPRASLHRMSTDTVFGLFLVLRCLFEVEPPTAAVARGQDVPADAGRPGKAFQHRLSDGTLILPDQPLPGYMPPMSFGALEPPEPADPTLVPRFPVVLMDDIPLVVVGGYMMTGLPPSVSDNVTYFRKWGRLRARPLRPSDRPWEVLAKMEASPQWLDGCRYQVRYGYAAGQKPSYHEVNADERQSGQDWLRRQLLRLVVALYPDLRQVVPILPYRINGTVQPTKVEVDAAQWDRVVADLKRHPIRWNAAREQYERVPEPAPPSIPTIFMVSPGPWDHPFSDVQPDDHWGSVYLAVERLRRAGIVVGYPSGTLPAGEQR